MSFIRQQPTTDHSTHERILVSGVVQGVGFRPFVYRIARELGLSGSVGNDSTQVFIDVHGTTADVERFVERLQSEHPPLAAIDTLSRSPVTTPSLSPTDTFEIVESRSAPGDVTVVPPDVAPCACCLAELRNPSDRRYGHPLISCTNCGPRYTIITALPYDRPATTLAGFPLCPACAVDYADPANRRFHAQPIGCNDCGPTVRWLEPPGSVTAALEGAFVAAAGALAAGRIIAIKGIGGFHLACDATDDRVVGELRSRKHRPDKPFAVMVPDLAAATALAMISPAEADLLTSPERPIVLLTAKDAAALSPLVAPDNPLVGVMLPSSPVHELLFDRLASGGRCAALVMTSANVAGTPIAYDDTSLTELLGLAAGVLHHDRPIARPCDDSVLRVATLGSATSVLPLRRARGFAPLPVTVARSTGSKGRAVLAVGGELKNAFCLLRNTSGTSAPRAWMSQHLGDMQNLETLTAFERAVDDLMSMYKIVPDVIAIDAHPGYQSAAWARRTIDRFEGAEIRAIQHHHAHVVSLLAEHGLRPDEKVAGFVFDGTGFGGDGTIWGGEVLIADATNYQRVAHLRSIPMPGGDAAIRSPYRAALAHLHAAGIEWDADLFPVGQLVDAEKTILRTQLDSGHGCIPTSSMGRLFDAVASLLGLRHRISFEAQAAIDLELAATRAMRSGPTTPMSCYGFGPGWDPTPLLVAIVHDVRSGRSIDQIALHFHLALVDLVSATALGQSQSDCIALTGGVFQNVLLTRLCIDRLQPSGLRTLTHRLVPPNDGGLALGQAYSALQHEN